MRRALLRNATLFTRNLLHHSSSSSSSTVPLAVSTRPRLRFFCSSSDEKPKDPIPVDVEDVDNKELKELIQKYDKGDEQALPSIMEAIFKRKLSGKHEETDEELVEELEMKPIDDVGDEEFESDLEAILSTDEDIDDLYYASDIAKNRMAYDQFFNMDENKWDDIVNDAIQHKAVRDTKECEDILEDMLRWDKYLPDDMKQKVEAKFNELGDMCERGELEPEVAFELFQKFEDEMVTEYTKVLEEQHARQEHTMQENDPPGEGPILRWQSRVVFCPGGDSWHPKNRKVKLAVTVKELKLSKYQFRRLRELVGKRYHPGRDELTITSERFEHREENRKDCLRTLLSIIEEASKADELVHSAQTSFVKERLRANPAFMERLHAKALKLQESNQVPVLA